LNLTFFGSFGKNDKQDGANIIFSLSGDFEQEEERKQDLMIDAATTFLLVE
jgi:hypothetical protein